MNLFNCVKRKLLWKFFCHLPKDKNKVVFSSYYGRGYSDSPKAVADELLKRNGYKIYWLLSRDAGKSSLPEGIKPIKTESISGIWHEATAGFWIDNCRKWSFTEKGKNQYYIQTWHGFPLKRIEKDAGDALEEGYITSSIKDAGMTDLMISNSSFLTGIYRSSFWYNGEILECGFPRNDILVKGDKNITEKIYSKYSIDKDTKILLYAPTFRKDKGLEVYDVDYKACTEALSGRFGGNWIVFAKLHPNVASKSSQLKLDPRYVIDASAHADIQELYTASAALLSDYSSVMFDYIATKKPCFLYVNDIENYKGDRNFYFDMGLLPFSLAVNNHELTENIMAFDEAVQSKNTDEFCRQFGISETGKASCAVADKIDEIRGAMK